MAAYTWLNSTSQSDWDRELAHLGGHPLQSALWGEARKREAGLQSCYLRAMDANSNTAWMARVETRSIGGFIKVGWIPRGPTCREGIRVPEAALRSALRSQGYWFAITDHWAAAFNGAPSLQKPQTIWIDLTHGTDALWTALTGAARNKIRKMKTRGAPVVRSIDRGDVQAFYELCRTTSEQKGFPLGATASLVHDLVSAPADGPIGAHLFVAKFDDRICGGALILKAGNNLSYIWGASNRALSAHSNGQTLHWAIIEWGISQGCKRYDLEGIDPIGNPGTYEFKAQFGGEEVTLAGKQLLAVSATSRLLHPWLSRRIAAGA